MARNRQRAKERQAERRAARQAARENSGAVPDAQRRVEAPPEELGQSGYTLEHTSESEEFIGDLEIGDEPYDGEDDSGTDTAVAGPRGVRGGREHEEHHREHSRVVGFLIASWAELQRVQWPNRQQLTSLTGITLLFVLIVGGYLGLLDAIFSKLVSAIL
ncbi:MAG TPA: preprotein translocase subunit SecE [Thermoleophilaceae bacterium]|jgi:preprotein translocase SecE subunit|nr:preprotein translocase subunit SecE [Thermoleophilaceae bacterium]